MPFLICLAQEILLMFLMEVGVMVLKLVCMVVIYLLMIMDQHLILVAVLVYQRYPSFPH